MPAAHKKNNERKSTNMKNGTTKDSIKKNINKNDTKKVKKQRTTNKTIKVNVSNKNTKQISTNNKIKNNNQKNIDATIKKEKKNIKLSDFENGNRGKGKAVTNNKKSVKTINDSKNDNLKGNHVIKKNDNKNTDNSLRRKKSIYKESLFSKNGKKVLIVAAVICGLIILLEFSYFLYQKISLNARSVYYDSLNSIVVDNTSIVAVGSSNFKYSKYHNYTGGLEKAKLIKYDEKGKIIFEKMYDRGINTVFSSILNVDDGYIVVGSGVFSKEEEESEGREAFIIKYDKDGNIVWEKYYQVVTNTSFNKVIAVNDGYVAIGQSIYANMEMGNHTTGGGIIVKYDKDGNEIWCNNHGGMKSGNFNDIVEVNGDLYVVGKDATDSANLVKFNANGEYEWHKNYSYTDGIGFSGIAYLNNYLYVVGSKKILPDDVNDEDNRDTTNTDGLLVKYDLNGKKVFEKVFGGSNYERYNSIIAHRSNLYVVGHTTSDDIGFKVVTDGKLMTGLVVCYDEDGNINKKEIFGGSHNDNLTDIVTDGGSLYITGYSNSNDGNIVTSYDNGKDYFGKIIQIDYRFRTKMVK